MKIGFTLFINSSKLFSRATDYHWWQTGFNFGVLSHPDNLTMDIEVTLKDSTMKNAFNNALVSKGYSYSTVGNKVSFTFFTPDLLLNPVVQQGNTALVNAYN